MPSPRDGRTVSVSAVCVLSIAGRSLDPETATALCVWCLAAAACRTCAMCVVFGCCCLPYQRYVCGVWQLLLPAAAACHTSAPQRQFRHCVLPKDPRQTWFDSRTMNSAQDEVKSRVCVRMCVCVWCVWCVCDVCGV